MISPEKSHPCSSQIELSESEDAVNRPNNALKDPQSSSFSIRRFVESRRENNIENHWPFSQQYLRLCLKRGVRNLLPPFDHKIMAGKSTEKGQLSFEDSIICPRKSKIKIKKKIKKQKTRSMAEILAVAPRSTIEDLDRRNGTRWAVEEFNLSTRTKCAVEETSPVLARRSARKKTVNVIQRTRSSSRITQRKNYEGMDEDDADEPRKLRRRAETVQFSKTAYAIEATPSSSSILLDGDHDHDYDISSEMEDEAIKVQSDDHDHYSLLEIPKDRDQELLKEDPWLEMAKDEVFDQFQEEACLEIPNDRILEHLQEETCLEVPRDRILEQLQEETCLESPKDSALDLLQEDTYPNIPKDRVLELLQESPNLKSSKDKVLGPLHEEQSPVIFKQDPLPSSSSLFKPSLGENPRKKNHVIRLMGKNLIVVSQIEEEEQQEEERKAVEERRAPLGFREWKLFCRESAEVARNGGSSHRVFPGSLDAQPTMQYSYNFW